MRHAKADTAAPQRTQRLHLRHRLLESRCARRTEASTISPAAVSFMPRGSRSNSGAPTSLFEIEDLLVHGGGGQVQRLGRLAH